MHNETVNSISGTSGNNRQGEQHAATIPRIVPGNGRSGAKLRMVRREETLTVRDSEVVGLLSQGLKDKEIAEELGIAHGSVRNRLLGIYRKLQVRTRTEAVVAYLNLKEYPIETS